VLQGLRFFDFDLNEILSIGCFDMDNMTTVTLERREKLIGVVGVTDQDTGLSMRNLQFIICKPI
jgi:hypothetical protein